MHTIFPNVQIAPIANKMDKIRPNAQITPVAQLRKVSQKCLKYSHVHKLLQRHMHKVSQKCANFSQEHKTSNCTNYAPS